MDERSSGSPSEEEPALTGVTSAQAVPIVVRKDGGGFELNEDRLNKILLRPGIQDKPLVVVSVAGAFRKGKSFLLNFFLRYMRNEERGDWLGNTGAPLEGFSWRGGSERLTTGILIWDEVFLVTRPDGSEVAVLLMDTQGAFDTFATVKDCATIFALSTLTSSVQVYNLSQNIQENDLQNLQYFTEYGRLAQEHHSLETPFQKLVFLVRDWQHHLFIPYGADGGTTFLNMCLNTPRRESEQQKLRDLIKSCFSEICCFLLPYPGRQVASGPSTEGCLPEMEEDFQYHLREFVVSVLAKDKLVTKRINGTEVTCKDWATYFSKYAEAFQKEELPTPKSLLEVTVDANNKVAYDKAKKRYEKGMKRVCGGPFKNIWSLQRHHEHQLKAALKFFASVPKFGGEEYSKPYEAILKKDIEETFNTFVENNKTKSCNGTPVVLSVPMLLSVGGAVAAAVVGGPVGIAAGVAGLVIGGTSAGTLVAWGVSRVTGKITTFREGLDSAVDYAWNKITGKKENVEDCDPEEVLDSNSPQELRESMPRRVEATWTPIVLAKDDHSFEFDEEALKGILLRDAVKDKCVVVVSVAGPLRKGKNFLLDCFIRYMRSQCKSDWLDRSNVSLGWLPRRVSCEPDSTCILFWNEVYLVTRSEGEQLAVLFMYTQGAFDGESTVNACAKMFALSTVTSSVQVYNLSQNITENDLQQLKVLTDEYESLLRQGKSDKLSQKLVFLVRDWSSPQDAMYGVEGGGIILDRLLQITEEQPNDFVRLLGCIRSCFTEISCFLMPHPGPKVATAASFDGSLSVVNDDFKKQLQELVPSLLSPNRLLVKQIDGQKISGKQLMSHFKLYVNRFRRDQLQESEPALEVRAEVNNLVGTTSDPPNEYTSGLEQQSGEDQHSLSPAVLEHHNLQGSAMECSSPISSEPEEEFTQEFLNGLTEEIDPTYQDFASQDEREEVLAAARTPATLCAVGLAFYLASCAFALLGLHAIASFCNLLFGMSLVSLGLWCYSFYSGHMREVGVEIDTFANIIWASLLEPLCKTVMQDRVLMPQRERGASEDWRVPPIVRFNAS